ncbi:MAG: M18 family aminopeptidase [Magnetococcales bacterium]|nr:M18 family aminopeptidase [Magnetococcales bacterium]
MNPPLIQRIIEQINRSPSPFHAVQAMTSTLKKKGFSELKERDLWQVSAAGRYFVVRDYTALIAFIIPEKGLGTPPSLRLAGAHTDSPTLKVKPTPLKIKKNQWVWDIEVYGSPILSTWLDRDLSLAGLIGYRDQSGRVGHHLINFQQPLARIPNLAIHLNPDTNNGFTPNRHTELNPILAPTKTKGYPEDARELLVHLLENKQLNPPDVPSNQWTVLDWDLCFYDSQPVQFSGLDNQWVVGARLDNLLSCFTGLEALCDLTANQNLPMLACFDHEEVGSNSTNGANGNFIESVLRRLFPNQESFCQTMANGQMISVDNAHGEHANFPNRQDENNMPTLGGGVVLKYNANQRYATQARSGSWFRALCQEHQIPTQHFTVRADSSCGSTIGPLLSARLGLSALDIGIPTWAMHSIRETACSQDISSLHQLWRGFYNANPGFNDHEITT